MNAKDRYSDAELLSRVARQEPAAFRILYDRYSRKIYAFSLRILADPLLAEEVMQESMLKIWQLGEGLIAIENLDAYLKTISRNYCYNILRRQQVALRVQGELMDTWEEAQNDTEELILLNEAKQLLQGAIDTLPPYHRKVYQLCHQEGYKYDEAAEKLQLSPHTIKTYMKQALRSIREHLRKHSDWAILFIIFKLF